MRILDRWWADLRMGPHHSHVRIWRPEQAILPEISIQDQLVHVRNVRDFTFHSATEFTPMYCDQTYHLDLVERAWFIIAPFTWEWRGPAHTFLSFSFANGQYLGISVEARRAAGEAFSIVKGALRQFDLMYVLGTERDLIGLRAVTWNDPVYLYPIRATREQVGAVLLGMLRRAKELADHPEFYNTFTNNCTTNILDAVNAIATKPFPYSLKILLPGYADALAFERGLIDTELSLGAARARFQINGRAQAAIGKPDFSERIRA